MKLINNKLRVSHYPQIPCKPFSAEVRNEREAYLLYQTLANQHLFLYDNNFIPDYSNILLVEMYEDGEWVDYWNEEEGMEWDEFVGEFENRLSGKEPIVDVEELEQKIQSALEECYYDDWEWNGEDEIRVVTFDKENAVMLLSELFYSNFGESNKNK